MAEISKSLQIAVFSEGNADTKQMQRHPQQTQTTNSMQQTKHQSARKTFLFVVLVFFAFLNMREHPRLQTPAALPCVCAKSATAATPDTRRQSTSRVSTTKQQNARLINFGCLNIMN